MWPTSVWESSVLRFFKQGSKCIVIKLAADGKICCVFLLMFGYNGKKPMQGPSLICLFTVRYWRHGWRFPSRGCRLWSLPMGHCVRSEWFLWRVSSNVYFWLLHMCILLMFMTSMCRLQQYVVSIMNELWSWMVRKQEMGRIFSTPVLEFTWSAAHNLLRRLILELGTVRVYMWSPFVVPKCSIHCKCYPV
jgi:hypothetical protein